MSSTSLASIALVGGLLAACAPLHIAPVAPPTVTTRTDRAPEFALTSQSGEVVSLSELRREGPVVVVFYRGFWCPWCREQLAELAHEARAFEVRGARLVAISVDPRDASVTLAERYDLPFPLLEDVGGLVSRVYAGVDVDGSALPSTFVVGTGGAFLSRHQGQSAADRVHTPELLAVLDAQPGAVRGAPGPRGGFRHIERSQLAVDLGAGSATHGRGDGAASLAGELGLRWLLPLGRNVLIGPSVRGALSAHPLVDASVVVKLRLPVLDGVDELYLAPLAGLTVPSDGDLGVGWHAGAQLGDQFALTPTWALFAQVGLVYERIGGAPDRDGLRLSVDFGVAWLL